MSWYEDSHILLVFFCSQLFKLYFVSIEVLLLCFIKNLSFFQATGTIFGFPGAKVVYYMMQPFIA